MEEEIKKSDAEIVQEFYNNPENKKRAAEMALQIKDLYSNWFTIPRLIKKFKVGQEDAAKKIEMLMFFNLCVGKVEKDVAYFRIDLDQRVQRELLSKQIEEKEGQILFLKEKLSKLE